MKGRQGRTSDSANRQAAPYEPVKESCNKREVLKRWKGLCIIISNQYNLSQSSCTDDSRHHSKTYHADLRTDRVSTTNSETYGRDDNEPEWLKKERECNPDIHKRNTERVDWPCKYLKRPYWTSEGSKKNSWCGEVKSDWEQMKSIRCWGRKIPDCMKGKRGQCYSQTVTS